VEVGFFCGVWVFCGVEGAGTMGLGGRLKHPLLELQGLSTGPTNCHKLFQCASSSLTRRLENFPGYPSQDYSIVSTLNCEVLKRVFGKRRSVFGDISSHFNPFKLHSGCYIHLHLKRTKSSLCITNRLTYKSS